MKHLLALRTSTQTMSTEVAQYIQSEAFEKHLDAMTNSDALRGMLTLHLLECIALDPMAERRMERPFIQGDNTTFFNIQLDRWTNFIPPFVLQRDSDLEYHLLKAIEDNVQGPLYAAAKAHREHDLHIGEVRERAEPFGQAASDLVKGKRSLFDLTQEEHEKRHAAYTRAVNQQMEPFFERGRQLAAASAPTFAGLSGSQAVATFLFDHLKDLELPFFFAQQDDQNPPQERSQSPSDDLNPAAATALKADAADQEDPFSAIAF